MRRSFGQYGGRKSNHFVRYHLFSTYIYVSEKIQVQNHMRVNKSFIFWGEPIAVFRCKTTNTLHPESDRAGYRDLDYKGNADISLNVSLSPPGVFRSGNILCSFAPHIFVFLKHTAFFLPYSLCFGVSASLSSSVFFLLHREQGYKLMRRGI